MGYTDAPPGWWREFVLASPARTDRAEEFGRRNAVPPEMLIRVTPTRIVAKVDISG